MPEDLSECDRIKALLQKKNNSQQSYVFVNAVNIFKGDSEIQTQIIPLILVKSILILLLFRINLELGTKMSKLKQEELFIFS